MRALTVSVSPAVDGATERISVSTSPSVAMAQVISGQAITSAI